MAKIVRDKNVFDISEFEFTQFSELPPSDEIQGFKIENFKEDKSEDKEYQGQLAKDTQHAQKNNFIISPIVRNYRGFEEYEKKEKEHRIQEEVNKQVSYIEEQAFKEGYERGVEKGKNDITEQLKEETAKKIDVLNSMIAEVLKTQHEILDTQKAEVYSLIRDLCKWIILRELKDDGTYIERLLERLLVEINSRSNVFIKVNKSYFEGMPEILEAVEEKLGKMQNVRVEVDYDIADCGIVLESENGIINATLEEQLNGLTQLFQSVGIGDE